MPGARGRDQFIFVTVSLYASHFTHLVPQNLGKPCKLGPVIPDGQMKTRVQKGDMTCPRPRALRVAALKFEPSALEQVGFVYCLVNKRHGGVGWHFSLGALGRAWKPGAGRRGQSSQKREGKRKDAESGLWSI